MESRRDVVVVGAGQAGLGAAKVIGDRGLDVVILERGRIGETWRSQRWESFALNTPNWMNGLPGSPYGGGDADGFMSHHDLVASFEEYVDRFRLDIRTGVEVTRLGRSASEPDRFVVEARVDGDLAEWSCSSVVVASGIARSPRIPAVADRLPKHIAQLSTGTYRTPEALPEGAVLVVGGGQSGAQIVEDLRNAARTVYFSISKVSRLPRTYRGRDFMDWMVKLGMWDTRTSEADPAMVAATNPLTSGVGPRGHTISFQQLASDGVHLMGRLDDVVDGVVTTDDRVPEYLAFADGFSQELKDNIDAYIEETGIDVGEPDPDPADAPPPEGADIPFLTSLDLEESGVGTVIWSTGFTADFSWIDLPVTDDAGHPRHVDGVAEVPGIYFIGFPWISKRKSGVVYGIEEDAEHIAQAIVARHSPNSRPADSIRQA